MPMWVQAFLWGAVAGGALLVGAGIAWRRRGAAHTAIAAGAILAMVADTMIPEAFERQHLMTGLIASIGFLTSFVLNGLTG